MPEIKLAVRVFDPVLPFDAITATRPGIDTWHEFTLITSKLRQLLPHVKEADHQSLQLSGGMSMQVPSVKIGIQIGTIKIDEITALVVDDGWHDILLGSDIIEKAFTVGQADREDVSVSSPWKEDVNTLSIEIYPIEMPFAARHFERFLKFQRQLYNVMVIVDHGLRFSDSAAIDGAIENDIGIPKEFVLQISAVDSGSIWIGLKSGATATLRRFGNIFDTSATAKLAQQMADAKKAETQAGISEETRDATASRIIAEQEMLRSENIRKTFDSWRKELESRVKFLDKLISQVDDATLRVALIRQKDEAIAEITQHQLLPMVKNIPRPYEPPDGVLLLSGPPRDRIG